MQTLFKHLSQLGRVLAYHIFFCALGPFIVFKDFIYSFNSLKKKLQIWEMISQFYTYE